MTDLNDMFFQECDDLLESLSSGLDDLENGRGDAETVNSMFRAVHSIKGGAGAFGLDQLVAFSHAMENLLDDVRAGRTAADETVVALLFTAADHLSDLVEAAREGEDLPPEQGASILGDLKLTTGAVEHQGDDGSGPTDETVPEFEPLVLTIAGDLPSLDDLKGRKARARFNCTSSRTQSFSRTVTIRCC